jgi:hypothetical protein
MIYYSETPERGNRIAAVMALLCGIGGVVMFGFAGFVSYTGIMQMIGIVLLMVAMIMFAQAQVVYTYMLQRNEDDGLDELAVIETRGRRSVTVCRLLLRDLKQLDECDRKNEKATRQKYHSHKIHSYCPDVAAARVVYLHFDEPEQAIVVRLQASERFLNELKARLS